ncbi:glycosyltransferase involved in cell wall biosynthesis [Chitinivorax tropicus]|uniref:Glycosyltransferase involved in cell wall biosynthesis n=1 Tax=Chitinivorax tropicus TaxID=714531 RepID=A0A840MLI8_9PROT|nr:glycosyltransferase [Chitinivorax tropicus]MBB5017053.1 glycosyltransferase involved in cell wall biosynthesis [Chitinivorax tropicus]
MDIFYPYNEIIPTRKAHDAYIWRNCASLAAAGANVTLACGKQSLAPDRLATYYQTPRADQLQVKTFPILRRNLGLPWTWNYLFNFAIQRHLLRHRPDHVLFSVFKQGRFHLSRRLDGIKYIYEVHELAWFPGMAMDHSTHWKIQVERDMLAQADLITTTTDALRDILCSPPYSLTNPIVVVPLAIEPPLITPPIELTQPLHVVYIGQLYEEQGIEDLVKVIIGMPGIHLTIVGGHPQDIQRIQAIVPDHAVERIKFTGFVEPARLPAIAASAHVLAAPFRACGRMPYVAHTKLNEYIAWRRPILAPDLPIVREHFPELSGLASYQADDLQSMTLALQQLQNPDTWQEKMTNCQATPINTWHARAERYLSILKGL